MYYSLSEFHLTPMHNFTNITMTQTDLSRNSAFETDTTAAQHRLQARYSETVD